MTEDRFKNWKQPEIEDKKLHPKYNFLVYYKDNLKLGEKTDIGAFTYINAKNGITIEKASGPEHKESKDNYVIFNVGSGYYQFTITPYD